MDCTRSTHILLDPRVIDKTLPQTMKFGIGQDPVIRCGHTLCIGVSDLQVVG